MTKFLLKFYNTFRRRWKIDAKYKKLVQVLVQDPYCVDRIGVDNDSINFMFISNCVRLHQIQIYRTQNIYCERTGNVSKYKQVSLGLVLNIATFSTKLAIATEQIVTGIKSSAQNVNSWIIFTFQNVCIFICTCSGFLYLYMHMYLLLYLYMYFCSFFYYCLLICFIS